MGHRDNSEDNTRRISTADFTGPPRITLEQATGDVNIEGWDRQEIEVSTDDDRGIAVEQTGSHVVIRSRPPKTPVIRYEGPDPDEFRRHFVLERGIEGLASNIENIASDVERRVERSMRRMGRRIGAEIELGHWAGGRNFTIKVPNRCDVNLRSSTGDLTIRDVRGALYLQTASGDVHLEAIRGPVIVHSASGDIRIDGISGKLGANTASGDISIEDANLEELIAHSASGDVNLEMLRVPHKSFDVKTVSGDLNVELPGDGRLTLQISTFSGDFHCSLPYERTESGSRRGREQNVIINGGGPMARFHSLSGDIDIMGSKRRSTDAPPLDLEQTSTEEPVGEPTMDLSRQNAPQAGTEQTGEGSDDMSEPEGYAARQQASLEILQAVERGEISAQDAVKRLSELENS
jgi:hypothetical protein